MVKYDPYHPDYRKLYPEIEITPEVLDVLEKSDRKMRYIEVDLKTERFIQSQETATAVFLPSREDSWDRMHEENHTQFANHEPTPEEVVVHKTMLERLEISIRQLNCHERHLIWLRYWRGFTQEKTAILLGLSQQVVSYKERRILEKLKKHIEK